MKRINLTKLLCTLIVLLGISSFGNFSYAEQVFGVELSDNKPEMSVKLDPGFVESSLQDTFSTRVQESDTKISMARFHHMSEKAYNNAFDNKLSCMYNT